MPARFVAFDLLALGATNWAERPFRERRAALEEALASARTPIHLTRATLDRDVAREWFTQFEGAGLDGIVAKPLDAPYAEDKRVMWKIKHERTADCVVAGYRLYREESDAIGSLLLGLYTDEGTLNSVGVIGAFPLARRRELFAELQPLVTPFEGHPWAWADPGEVLPDPSAGSGDEMEGSGDEVVGSGIEATGSVVNPSTGSGQVKLKAEDKTAVEEAVKALKDVKDKDDTEVIQKAMSALSDAIQKVGAAMYAEAKPEAGSTNSESSTEASSGADASASGDAGPTVDAEFKEKE